MGLALDIPRLLKRISHLEGDREDSREYQRDIAAEFTKRGDKMDSLAVQRWRRRGSMPTARLLLLLKIAEDRGISINLLDFAMPDDAFEIAPQADRPGNEGEAQEAPASNVAAGAGPTRERAYNRDPGTYHREHWLA